jgi:clan AA aspartic protease
MGLSLVILTLRNPRFPELPAVEAQALVDTGSTFLCVPGHIAELLKLDTFDQKEATIADGSRRLVPYVGPVEIRFKNRVALGGALVMGDQVVLGAIPMEDMDLVVCPRDWRVDVNPASPDVASCIVKAGVALEV